MSCSFLTTARTTQSTIELKSMCGRLTDSLMKRIFIGCGVACLFLAMAQIQAADDSGCQPVMDALAKLGETPNQQYMVITSSRGRRWHARRRDNLRGRHRLHQSPGQMDCRPDDARNRSRDNSRRTFAARASTIAIMIATRKSMVTRPRSTRRTAKMKMAWKMRRSGFQKRAVSLCAKRWNRMAARRTCRPGSFIRT